MLLDVLFSSNVSLSSVIISIVSSLAVIFLTMPIHEYAHALAATKLGDPTPRYTGRLHLSPFAHIDYFGALCILLVGFGWAKPVQVNPNYFQNPKRDMAITAFAGPLSNLCVAFVGLFIYNLFYFFTLKTQIIFLYYIALFFFYISQINIGLAVFNLIPVPPLDGSRLLAAFLPDRLYYRIMQYERYLYFAVIILVFTGVLDRPLSFVISGILSAFNNITSLPFGLFI